MSPLLLSLTLSGAPAVAAQYPYQPVPVAHPPFNNPYRSWYPPQTPAYQPGYPQQGYPQQGYPQQGQGYFPQQPGGFPQNPGPFPPGVPAQDGPVTLRQFAALFVPTPGHHSVWIVHPKTGRPVNVCFDLPDCGHAPKVCVHSHSIEFEYRKLEVEIEFKSNGTVKVGYDD